MVYAIDDVSNAPKPIDSVRRISYQLQDVVTHGNFKDRILNHNLFTIGDGNDANVDENSDEDDYDDVIDRDGVVDRAASKHSKFANFALNADKSANRLRNVTRVNSSRPAVATAGGGGGSGGVAGVGGAAIDPSTNSAVMVTNRMGDGSNRGGNHMIQRQNQSDASNNKQLNNEQHELNQGQRRLEDNMMATRLPNRQMTYKHTSKSRGFWNQFCWLFVCVCVCIVH